MVKISLLKVLFGKESLERKQEALGRKRKRAWKEDEKKPWEELVEASFYVIFRFVIILYFGFIFILIKSFKGLSCLHTLKNSCKIALFF